MEIFSSLEEIENKPAVVLAVGAFDGLHQGHHAIINTVRDEAKRRGVKSMIITFSPTPREVLSGQNEIALMKPEERVAKIESMGIDIICLKHFDLEFAKMERDDFIKRLLTYLDLKALVAGPDHNVGRKHKGDVRYLHDIGESYGFDTIIVPKARYHEDDISSQQIRKMLKEGRIDDVNTMLGYPYCISGTVVSGVKRGRSLGYPTLNVKPDLPTVLIPEYGVYCVRVHLESGDMPAICNIGVRPTFVEDTLSIEVHVMDEHLESQYGKPVEIEFEHFVRKERKFETKEALIEQIKQDIEKCKNILTEEKCQL